MRQIFAFLAFILHTAPVHAQQEGQQQPQAQAVHGMSAEQVVERLRTYIKTPEHEAQIYKAIGGIERVLRGVCKSVNIKRHTNRELMSAPVFAQDVIRPIQGIWRERWEIDRCGALAYHNLQFLAQPDGPPQVLVLVPGTSDASLKLQNQTAVGLISTAKRANTACKTHLVANTEKLSELQNFKTSEQGQPVSGYWTERWSVFSCGQVWSINIRFEFQSNGTMVSKVEG